MNAVPGGGGHAGGPAGASAGASAPIRPRPTRNVRRRERPLGRRIGRLGLVGAIVFGALTLGAGYWQVVNAERLTTDASDAAVIAAERTAIRGRILDRTGKVLASTKEPAEGDPYRVYADDAVAHPVGYASRIFGSSGLEAAYAAELLGTGGGDAVDRFFGKFLPEKDRRADLRTGLSLALQKRAVALLGKDRGAVVAMDPRTGEIIVMASTPTFDASAIADPASARKAFDQVRQDGARPLLNRATRGRYVPGSVQKIVTALAGLESGAVKPDTTFEEQPEADAKGLLVSGFRIRDGHHAFTGDEELDFFGATEVSCNIWYALAGLQTGGEALDATARRLGFGGEIPFDLPTLSSQLTNAKGRLPGGFTDDVELANAAYGQGETLVTPLQMALVAATVANGGEVPRPHLVTAFVGADGSERPADRSPLGRAVSGAVASAVREAMVRAVNSERGRRYTTGAALPNVSVAGKSGTAQLGGSGEPHSWFIGFAPAENPTIAIAVVVEKAGAGAERASPLAGDLLRAWFRGEGE